VAHAGARLQVDRAEATGVTGVFSNARTRHGGGHGLGLAIVSAVAIAHNASLSVGARPEGGLDVTVMFRS
jgi:K+-sensing histidine kinase KdpD